MPGTPVSAPTGTSPCRTGRRSSRRACSTLRRPLPASRPPMASTATTPTTQPDRIRKSRRRRSGVSSAGTSPSSGGVITRRVTIQVTSPIIRARPEPMPGCGSRRMASRPSTANAKNTRSGSSGCRRIREAAYAQIPSTTTAVPPIRRGLSRDPTRWTRKTASAPGVKSRTAMATASTGLASARRAVAAAWLSAMPDAPAITPASASRRRDGSAGRSPGPSPEPSPGRPPGIVGSWGSPGTGP